MANLTPAPAERVRFLDFARGFAILSIVVFHALSPVATGMGAVLIQFGGAGIHAFVLLSGFGLELSTMQRSLRGFYRRRISRILIPYFLFITGLFLLNMGWSIYPASGLRAYLGHVLLFKMFDESIIGSFGYHFWFLSTIIQLYLVFPVLFFMLERWGATHFFALSALISSFFTAFVIASGRAELRVFNGCGLIYLWEFSLGMIAGQRYVSRGERFWEMPWRWLLPATVVGLVAQAALSIWGGPTGELLNNPASLVGYSGVLIMAYRVCQSLRRSVLVTWTQRIGEISYPLYLVHGVIITRLTWWLAPIGLWPQLTVAAVTIGISIASAGAFDIALRWLTSVRSQRIAASSGA